MFVEDTEFGCASVSGGGYMALNVGDGRAAEGVDGAGLAEAWRLEHLVTVVQELSLARDVAAVQNIVRHAARRLGGAAGATFVLRDEGQCFYADEDAIEPLWKGLRFPLEACISGWAMLHRQQVAIPDIYADDRIPHDAYRPTFVKSLLMTPIRTLDPLGAIGVYWADHHQVNAGEAEVIQALADTTAVALESARLWEGLEESVRQRTLQLSATNQALAAEVTDARMAEEHVRELSMTDELTGLNNRRGFLLRGEQALRATLNDRKQALVIFVDLDGLKPVNDELGHASGDALLVAAADVLRRSFRDSDIVARVGGDEFAILVPNAEEQPELIQGRIESQVMEANQRPGLPAPLSFSIGTASATVRTTDSLEALMAEADALMYARKRARHGSAPRRR
jgi:diguanylate cyclase (GGDEF)-like protein